MKFLRLHWRPYAFWLGLVSPVLVIMYIAYVERAELAQMLLSLYESTDGVDLKEMAQPHNEAFWLIGVLAFALGLMFFGLAGLGLGIGAVLFACAAFAVAYWMLPLAVFGAWFA